MTPVTTPPTYQDLQRLIRDLTDLNALSQSLLQELNLDEVLLRILSEANRMLHVENASVLLLDEPTGDLYFAASVSQGQPNHIHARLKPDQGVAGWVLTHGTPVCLNDVSRDTRWFGEVEPDFKTRSLLCVPLRRGTHIIGVLEVLNRRDDRGFTEHDITRLTAFAGSASIAIQNARLFAEASEARRLRTLNEFTLSLSGRVDLAAMLTDALSGMLTHLDSDAGVVWLTEPATGQPVLQARLGLVGDLPAAWPALAVAALKRPAGIWQPVAAEALVLLPFNLNANGQGVLLLRRRDPSPLHPEACNLLVGMVQIVALSAQNARLHHQMQTQTLHLTYLNDIGSALTRTLNVEHVLQMMIDSVNTLLETERTSIFLIDPDTNELVLRYTNQGETEIRLAAPWQGIAGWVATHDQPALVNDTLSDPRHLRQVAIDTGYQAHAILCVPINVEGEVLGVVQVLNKTNNQQFNHQHQALLIQFTRWAAIALKNARLFEQRINAYEQLAEEQNRRVAAETRGAMAAIVLDMAHTMNNVVGAIRVWANQLAYFARQQPDVPLSRYQRQLDRIQQNAQEAINLIGDITDPLEVPQIGPIDLEAVLNTTLQSIWLPQNVTIRRQIPVTLPPVQANARRLEAVFHNLLSNAVQVLATQGGHIDITVHTTHPQRPKVAIRDDGPGIPPDIQEHVFKPGFSGKNGSLGIGLWLAETFVHQFGGDIHFTTAPGAGTTFVVELLAAGGNDE